jgi:rhamnose utilization protein RhaD (predicted bifunctional aldolase and dehydrogenase)/NAD(P)-dependent dehydrogenase (short-subunit alcohol dehydrogenase family)
MTDEALMAFLGRAMLRPHVDPLPSVETPLHSILPHPVIVHTHDVATMSLTNLSAERGRQRVSEAFGERIPYVPYVRPGFPLARAVARLAPALPAGAEGLALAHHGLVVWGESAEACWERLCASMERARTLLTRAVSARGGITPSGAPAPDAAARARAATTVLPVLRGVLSRPDGAILHWDDTAPILETLASARFKDLSRRGVATPEHILRAGRLPLWLDLDLGAPADRLAAETREQLAAGRADYDAYHARHAPQGQAPIPDWAKVVLIPGLGMVTAFKDKASAQTAATCYRSVIESIRNAEALGGFEFIPEPDVFFFEHWPLERRKVEEGIARERKTLLLPRHVTLIAGGGSGIGEAAAWRFAEEGAHVVVADLDEGRAGVVAEAIRGRHGARAIAVALDVRDEGSVRDAVGRAVREYGGLDSLFYTAGLAPAFAPVLALERREITAQLDIHYIGALMAVREAAAVMARQGSGGSIIGSVSKAALAPAREAAAYGGSKAALLHALRSAALELGPLGIRVNAINADQIETPLFLRFAEARAQAASRTLEDQLEEYRRRNALGVSLIPPRAVAEIAVLLASDRFRYTTGDILTIDGGLADAFPR